MTARLAIEQNDRTSAVLGPLPTVYTLAAKAARPTTPTSNEVMQSPVQSAHKAVKQGGKLAATRKDSQVVDRRYI